MTQARAWLLVYGVIAALTSRGFAEPTTVQAQSLFDEGRRLIMAGKIVEACDAFEASEKLDPAVTTLLNLAECRQENQQIATAWRLFVDAGRMARDTGNNKLEKVATNQAHKLEPRLSKLTIKVPVDHQVPGVEVLRGSDVVDPVSWNHALPIDGGSYTIAARAPGREPWSTTIAIQVEADTQTIEIPTLSESRPKAPPTIAREGNAPAVTPPAEPTEHPAPKAPPPSGSSPVATPPAPGATPTPTPTPPGPVLNATLPGPGVTSAPAPNVPPPSGSPPVATPPALGAPSPPTPAPPGRAPNATPPGPGATSAPAPAVTSPALGTTSAATLEPPVPAPVSTPRAPGGAPTFKPRGPAPGGKSPQPVHTPAPRLTAGLVPPSTLPQAAVLSPAEYKSPGIALTLSLGVTLGGVAMLALSARESNGTVVAVGTVATVIGPTLGHTYAGHTWNTGLALRLAGAGTFGVGFVVALSTVLETRSSPADVIAIIAFLGGLGLYGAGTVVEVATAPAAAREYNRVHAASQGVGVSLAPIRGRDGYAPGLVIAGRF